jgi:hypothetical protein
VADLLPNRAQTVKRGTNVTTPLGILLWGDAYRLSLCPELGSSTRAVLLISMTLQYQFEDGDALSWSGTEKANWVRDSTGAIKSVWNNKFRIKTPSGVPASSYRDVGVQFDFKTYIDGYHIDDDYELGVKKIKPGTFRGSSCHYKLGNATLDSEDIVGTNKGGSMKQRGVVHEFGHMLGLRDEYADAHDNTHWTGDADSIMHSGELVRERHYVPFATWITEQFATAAHLARSPIDYKVSGTWDKHNAKL